MFGITFKNPVGLAAGFDKNERIHQNYLQHGFGFWKLETLPPKPPTWESKKRLFRLYDDHAIINRWV